MDQKKNILETADFSVSFDTYAGEVQAVRSVSFDLAEGEIVAIVGESGSGKSVMTQSLLKLIPTARIKSGTVKYNGTDISSYNHKQLTSIKGSQISLIFQDPMTSLNPTMKVGKQIVESLKRHTGMTYAQAKTEAVELLRSIGIPNPKRRFGQYPHELSGGMRQRAMIAIAMACKPKVLIADEPTTALDVSIQSHILGILKDLNKRLGMTILLITHDMGIVAGMADRVMVMYGGKVVETGKCDDIFYRPLHPYTQGLLASIPRLDIDVKKQLEYIIGSPPDMLRPPKGCAFAPRCKYAMQICKEIFPEEMVLADGHSAFCWLTHPQAKGVKESVDEQVSKHD